MNIYPSRNKQNITTDVYIDGVEISDSRVDIDTTVIMPFFTTVGSFLCCPYRDTFCILNGTGLYVFNGKGWEYSQAESIGTTIRNDYQRMIDYDNDLHVFNCNSGGNVLSDWVWDGEQLTQNLTFNGSVSISDYYSVIEYHGELYIPAVVFRVSNRLGLYIMDLQNSTLIRAVDLYDAGFDTSDAIRMVVYNDEIHILNGTSHYKWNGTVLSSVSTIPIDLSNGFAITWNNKIHIIKDFDHYSWNGTAWSKEPNTMFKHYTPSTEGGVYNNKLYLLGGVGVMGIETISSIPPKDVTIS